MDIYSLQQKIKGQPLLQQIKGQILATKADEGTNSLQQQIKGQILATKADEGTDTCYNNRSRNRYSLQQQIKGQILNKTTLIMGQILATQQIKGQAHGRTSLFNTNLEISVSLII